MPSPVLFCSSLSPCRKRCSSIYRIVFSFYLQSILFLSHCLSVEPDPLLPPFNLKCSFSLPESFYFSVSQPTPRFAFKVHINRGFCFIWFFLILQSQFPFSLFLLLFCLMTDMSILLFALRLHRGLFYYRQFNLPSLLSVSCLFLLGRLSFFFFFNFLSI